MVYRLLQISRHDRAMVVGTHSSLSAAWLQMYNLNSCDSSAVRSCEIEVIHSATYTTRHTNLAYHLATTHWVSQVQKLQCKYVVHLISIKVLISNVQLKKRNNSYIKIIPVCNLTLRPLPDSILQPWRKHDGCEIKSGSGLGTRLSFVYVDME